MSEKTLDQLVADIEQWGNDKGILPAPLPMAQLMKTQEEVDELRAAIIQGNPFDVKDAIGDIVVTLIMQCGVEAWDTTFKEAVESAYETIKNRTGKMQNGQFIKDEE